MSRSLLLTLAAVLLQTQQTFAQSAAAAPTATQGSNAASSSAAAGSGSAVDTDAGASGSDTSSSFTLSKGGLIAIVVIVVLVAVFGIASTVLFVIAKRRQWNIRASISRASRRLTGRFGESKSEMADRRRRRTGMIPLKSNPRPDVRVIRPPGQKQGLVINVNADVEKGASEGPTRKNKWGGEKPWSHKLWGNDWK